MPPRGVTRRAPREMEIIPDSEEEIEQSVAQQVIEISSSSDESDDDVFLLRRTTARPRSIEIPSPAQPLSRSSGDTIVIDSPTNSSREVSQLLPLTASQLASEASLAAVDALLTVVPLRPSRRVPSVATNDSPRRGGRNRVNPAPSPVSSPRRDAANATPGSSRTRTGGATEAATSAPATPRRNRGANPNTPRSRAAPASEEQLRLEKIARDFYDELTVAVFDKVFGDETPIKWNKRLTRTVGRAHYSRHTNGVEESCIELSVKVADREDRIKNTMAHEMCHLAVWRISKVYDRGHGAEWQNWAEKVMKERPELDIKVTVGVTYNSYGDERKTKQPTHSYEPEHPYKWRCATCSRIYGRWTRSINTATYVCECNGELEPMAPTNAPVNLTGNEESSRPAETPVRRPASIAAQSTVVIDLTNDDDSEMEELTCAVGSVIISEDF